MSKFHDLFQAYRCDELTQEQVDSAVEHILAQHKSENDNIEVYKQCLSQIDLTTLLVDDTDERVALMAQKVNDFHEHYADTPNVAAICVYPTMVPHVRAHLTAPGVGIASVAAGFPASQTFVEIKVAEVAMAVMEGATEIDVVLPVGKFLQGRYEEVYDELCEIKAACRQAHLKVILETGALQSAANIKKASILAMQAGADFIKTSTGKVPVNATPQATYIMCQAIKQWHEQTGQIVGYKPAGGVRTTDEAVQHYTLVKHILGEPWLTNKRFRFGASSLANNLLSSITGKTEKYF